MMITELSISESIFDPQLDLSIVFNPVNTKGISGKGLAKEFATRFPDSQRRYGEVCKQKIKAQVPKGFREQPARPVFDIGDLIITKEVEASRMRDYDLSERLGDKSLHDIPPEELEELIEGLRAEVADAMTTIVYFPTKRHWRNPSRLSYIQRGLETFVTKLPELEVAEGSNVGIPALGCGLGGLDWEDVKQVIEDILSETSMNYFLFPPR